MNKLKFGKRTGLTVVLITLALVMCLSVSFAAILNSGLFNASAEAVVGGRVTIVDLMNRYPVEYVLGPISATDVNNDGKIDRNDINKDNGKYIYIEDEAHKDINGNYTNNIYGIPADQYFDVESYIYTVEDTTNGGRELLGWKKDIQASVHVQGMDTSMEQYRKKLAENGEMLNVNGKLDSTTPSAIGIYVTYVNGTTGSDQNEGIKDFQTTEKYAIIVPDDVTKVGQGSGAFATSEATYYATDDNVGSEKCDGTEKRSEYTDFACFITDRQSGNIKSKSAPYYWQPVERLAGIYFTENSNLKEIAGATDAGFGAMDSTARTRYAAKGKAAFESCNSMRFLVLPEGLTKIGQYAFHKCEQLTDTNIPTTVATVGKQAYKKCLKISHISISENTSLGEKAFDECSFKHVDKASTHTSDAFPASNSTVFVMGNRPENGVADTGAFVFEYTSAGKLSAVSLAGETGEDPTKVFVFPDIEDFNDDASNMRRSGVGYDYLNCNGNKVKSSLEDISATEYDIATNFANLTWCQNVVLPEAVKTIGTNAFKNSHVGYLETYATTIGFNAFYEDDISTARAEQWFYIHRTKEANGSYSTTYALAGDEIRGASGKRHIVYENYEMYNAFGGAAPSWLNKGETVIHYQIPIIANIQNDDDEAITFKAGDMVEYFFNDSDYVENPSIKSGNNEIVYTKKLSDNVFANTKHKTGEWTADAVSAAAHSRPTLGNMTKTVWYDSDDYDNTVAEVSAIYQDDSTAPLNIYTKNIAKPQNIKDGTYDGEHKGNYTFGNTYAFGENEFTLGDDATQCIDYFTALGLSDDYVVSLKRFTYADGMTNGTDATTSVRNAGTYTFALQLNSKWGVWTDDYLNAEANKEYFTATVAVARKQIDYSSLDKIPEFVNANSEGESLHGSATPLYNYNDGWYVAQQAGKTLNETRNVTNSYLFFIGSPIAIKLDGEVVSADGNSSMLGDSVITRSNCEQTNSLDYPASFEFRVKYISGTTQSNYIFYYGNNDSTKYNNLTDDNKGLKMTAKQDFSFRLTKQWYIVIETNMFVIDGSADSYAPLASASVHYSDTLTAQIPALNKGNSAGKIKFEILYAPLNGNKTTIKEQGVLEIGDDVNVNTIGYYINSYMPVGEYTLKLYGDAVTAEGKSYAAITAEYAITVLPKAMNAVKLQALHNALNVENAYAINGDKKLHASIENEKEALSNDLQMPASGNYWSDKTQYYDSAVTITYNIDGRGSTTYNDEGDTLNLLTAANNYTLYYCVSAKNYETVGGAEDPNRRDYSFRITLFTEITLASIYALIIDEDNNYFKDVKYTGLQVQTRVPANQYYKYSFDDVDVDNKPNYIKARPKASVTLTLFDSELARWNDDVEDEDASKYFKLSDDGKSLQVFFNINPATNSWSVVPQMPSWSFNGFDKSVNFITAGLMFDGADVEYALSTDLATWTTFTVDNNGMVDDATAEMLNKLKPASYYLRSTISDITYVNEKGETVTNVQGDEFITQNASGNPIKSVNISKAVNSWTETPTVMTWTWGSYDKDRNTISATATYPTLKPTYGNVVDKEFVYTNDGNALPVVTFSIQRRVGDTLVAIAGLESFTTVDNAVSDILAGLHAGTYVLTTSVGGSDYYTQIVATSTNFVITKAVNSWTTTPQITQWTWGQFKQDVNVISAEAQFNGGDGSEGSQDNAITFSILNSSHVAVNTTLSNFVLTNGTYSQDVANALKDLPAGKYYLRAAKVGNNDYADIAGTNSTDIPFTVAKASNSWQTSPAVTSWQYTRFDADSNFIAGIPTYSTADKVVYKLVDKTGNEITLGYTYENDVIKLNDAAVKALTELTVGNYTINVTLAGTDDYSELPATLSFSVVGVANSWDVTPLMTSWQYKGFKADANFLAGVPANLVNVENAVVTYTISGNGITPIVFTSTSIDFTSTSIKDVEEQLRGLKVFDTAYTLQVSYPADNNYNELTSKTTFKVTKATNSWNVTPGLTGWVYQQFDAANFRAGTPAFNEDASKKVVYTLTTANGNSFAINGETVTSYVLGLNADNTLTAATVAALNTLAVNNYTLSVTLAGTDDYYDMPSTDIQFSVNQSQNNAWKPNGVPEIGGWVYGAFNADLLKAGEAVIGGNAVVYTIQTVLANGEVGAAVEGYENLTFAELIAKLGSDGIPAGNYNLYAATVASVNYNTATHNARFTVSKAANDWKADSLPTIEGWTYGDNPQTPATGATVNANGGITSAYYIAKQINGVWVTQDEVENIANAGVGTYAYVTKAAASTNYEGVTYTAIFVISAATNSWKNGCEPEGTLEWSWGAYEQAVQDTGFIKAEAQHGNLAVAYRIVTSNGVIDATQNDILTKLATLGVGRYEITVSVDDPDGNYSKLSKITYVNVINANFTWAEGTTPADSSWTWGVSDDNKTFVEPQAVPVQSTDKYSVKYEIRLLGAQESITYTDKTVDGNLVTAFEQLQSNLFGRDAGTYVITVTVSGDNYNDLSATVQVTINKATISWTQTVEDTNWFWNNKDNNGKVVTKPTATDAKGNNVEFVYSVTDKDDVAVANAQLVAFDSLKTILFGADVNVYSVTLSATETDTFKLANYNAVSASFTVEVKKSANSWTANKPEAHYEKVFNATLTIPAAEAAFGTVIYTDAQGNAILNNDISAWVNSRDSSDENYTFITKVIGSVNYDGIEATTTLKVTGLGCTWSCEDGAVLKATYTFTYSLGDALKNSLGTIVLPYMSEAMMTLTDGGTTKYTVTYVNYDDKENIEFFPERTFNNADQAYSISQVISLLQSKAAAGTYTIKSEYTPVDGNYSKAYYTVTINVYRATTAWDNEIETDYNNTFEDVQMPTPTAGGYPVKITVTDSKGNNYPMPADGNLTELLNTLNVGTYTVTSTVEATDNYTGLSTVTTRVVINPAPNNWVNNSVLQSVWRFERLETFNISVPQSLRGTVRYVLDGTPLQVGVDLNKHLNDNADRFTAGDYNLSFVVDEDANGNYNGLVYDCVIRVVLKSNAWDDEKEPEASHVWSGNVNVNEFTIPVPKVGVDDDKDLLRFDIVKAGLGYTSLYNLNRSQFLAQLAELVNGTYTITMHVGGNYSSTDLNSGDIATYNKNYEYLEGTTVITITPHANSWTTGFVGASWTYGDKIGVSGDDTLILTPPQAAYGNHTITYYVNGTNSLGNSVVGGPFKGELADTTKNAAEAFRLLLVFLQGCDAGAYTVTATVASTDVYEAPQTVATALFTVNKVTPVWTISEANLEQYKNITWTWGASDNPSLPTLKLSNWSNEAIALSIVLPGGGSVTVKDDPNTEEIIEGWNYFLTWNDDHTRRNAGTYRIVATVAAGINNEALSFEGIVVINPVTTVWDANTSANDGERYNWIYKATDNATIAKPVLGNWAEGTISYKVTSGNAIIYTGNLWDGVDADNHLGVIETLKKQTAGTYVITATVEGDTNHTSLSYSNTLVVSVAANSWTNDSTAENATVIWTFGSADNEAIKLEPTHDEEGKLKILVNNKVINESLEDYLATCGVNTYTITASVPATSEYGALERTITLTITKSTSNGWVDDVELNIVHKITDKETKGWVWGDLVQDVENGAGVIIPVPQIGSRVIITVYNGSVEQFNITLNYTETDNSKTVNSPDLDALLAKLRALNVGTYSITAEIPESADYAAFKQAAFEFTIDQATNSWVKAPSVIGWNYNATTAYPDATPKYGNKNDVEYSYVAKGEYADAADVPADEWQATQPIKGGVYYLRGILHGTDNYTEIVGYYTFSIGTGENAWVNMPGVIAWNWNNYNKTINQFSGSARSGGVVKFTVNKVGESDYEALKKSDLSDTSLDEKKLQGFSFVIGSDGKATKYISDDVAQVLNALKPGKYNLYAVVVADENYQSIEGNMPFEVGKANNAWTTAPNMLSYNFGSTVAGDNLPIFTEGKAMYGNSVTYQIDTVSNGATTALLSNLTASDVTKLINGQYKVDGKTVVLNAGNYVLKAWVAGGSTYNEFYSKDASYQVLFSINRIENGWKEGNEPKTSINEYYTNLHVDGFNFNTWFGNPQTIYNDEIVYTLLNTDYTVAKAGEFKYANLFDEIKGLSSGDYIVRMAVKESGNYLALTADTSVSIQRKTNSLTLPAENLSGQWQLGEDGANATTLDTFTVTASQGGDAITYTINSVKCATLAELQAEVAKLNAGSYQVTVAVAQTNDYEGVSSTIQLDVKQGENELHWDIDDDWIWHNGLAHFTGSKPQHGDQVTVEITKKNSTSASSITVDFTAPNPLAIINQIICGVNSDGGIIGGLDAGEYTIKVTASATANWKEISETKTFTINKTSNSWTNAPTLNGTLNAETNVYEYEYGTAVTPQATAQHGTIKYTYYVKGDTTPLSGAPVDVGEYYVEASVDETDNHQGIATTTVYFKINKVLNDRFIVSPAAVGWTWGDYKTTVHMFTGIPRSGGEVSFSILDENKQIVVINGIELDKILLVDKDGVHHNDVDKDLYVPTTKIGSSDESYASLIAQLKKGNYFLQINVAATDNSEEFTNSDARFRVDLAENGWKVTPKIASWSLELWSAEKNSPQAEPRFGTAHIVVTSQNNNEVFYDNMYLNTETGEREVLNRLAKALAGWYKMTVTVDELEGCYTGLDETVNVQVYMRGSNETKNYWYETFGINAWEAIVGGIGNEPYGTPLRGLPYFEFYYAKGEGASAEIDWDRPVVAGDDSYLVNKGDNKYYKDFYVPMAPGYYFMVACAVNVDSEGNVIAADNLRETEKPYPLHIEHRANTFDDDPHIATLLFLGERNQWAEPTVKASLADSEIWFTYENLATGEQLGRNMPNAEGRYRVTAHILAKYSKEEKKWADFEVQLSTNEWITQPTIDSWSEEFDANSPEALAKVGSENIVYTYENLDTGEIKNEKPTTEGSYKMTATIKVEGYRDLVGTTTFTIEPAFNSDLVVIDIILGVVACALAIFVIIFAIRRYKEN